MTYWFVALLLTVFGFVAGFSIGPPFLLIGLAMLVLGPLRRWPRVFWPPLVAVVAFVIALALLVPLWCVATTEVGGVSATVCTSIAGPSWAGTGLYNPPPEAFDTPVHEGLVVAVASAVATLAWLTIRRRASRPDDPTRHGYPE